MVTVCIHLPAAVRFDGQSQGFVNQSKQLYASQTRESSL